MLGIRIACIGYGRKRKGILSEVISEESEHPQIIIVIQEGEKAQFCHVVEATMYIVCPEFIVKGVIAKKDHDL